MVYECLSASSAQQTVQEFMCEYASARTVKYSKYEQSYCQWKTNTNANGNHVEYLFIIVWNGDSKKGKKQFRNVYTFSLFEKVMVWNDSVFDQNTIDSWIDMQIGKPFSLSQPKEEVKPIYNAHIYTHNE